MEELQTLFVISFQKNPYEIEEVVDNHERVSVNIYGTQALGSKGRQRQSEREARVVFQPANETQG